MFIEIDWSSETMNEHWCFLIISILKRDDTNILTQELVGIEDTVGSFDLRDLKKLGSRHMVQTSR